MKCLFALSIILPVLATCPGNLQPTSSTNEKSSNSNADINPYGTVGEIPLPKGFERIKVLPNSFESYLRNLPLKRDKTIFLYNGKPRSNQDHQFAVINVSIGT